MSAHFAASATLITFRPSASTFLAVAEPGFSATATFFATAIAVSFLIKAVMPYPSREAELELLARYEGGFDAERSADVDLPAVIGAEEVLALPVYPELSEEEVRYVAKTLREIAGR